MKAQSIYIDSTFTVFAQERFAHGQHKGGFREKDGKGILDNAHTFDVRLGRQALLKAIFPSFKARVYFPQPLIGFLVHEFSLFIL